jgi:hypothetical protein
MHGVLRRAASAQDVDAHLVPVHAAADDTVPAAGTRVTVPGYVVVVEGTDGRKITRVLLEPSAVGPPS